MTTYREAAEPRLNLIRQMILTDFPPPARVLDLGAAPGDQCIQMAHDGYTVTAVDLGEASDQWGGAQPGTMAAAFTKHGVELVMWNLDEQPYPLPDSTYDAIVMTEVLEHLRDYPARALQEAWRVLKPGGRLYLTTPNAAYVRNRFKLAAGRSVATPLRDWIDGLPHARHAREYTFGEVHELLAVAGFDVVTMRGGHFHIQSGRQSNGAVAVKRLVDVIARVRPEIGPTIVAVAERH